MLLRLFPQFRALVRARDAAAAEAALLRSQLAEQSTQSLILQDRLDSALNDRAELWSLTKECINNERATYQRHVNEQWQKQYGIAPYPDAAQLPHQATAKPVERPVVPRSMLPSEGVRRATQDFFKTLYAVEEVE